MSLNFVVAVIQEVPIREIRELIQPIKPAKRMIETLEDKLFLVQEWVGTANAWVTAVYDREAEIIYESPRTVVVNPRGISSSRISKMIQGKNFEKFKLFLESVNDAETIETITNVLENEIIPSYEGQMTDLRDRIENLKSRGTEVLNAVENQLRTVFETISADRNRLESDLKLMQDRKSDLTKKIRKSKQCLSELSTPIFPSVLGSTSRSENSVVLNRSLARITELDASSIQRIRTMLRRIPSDQHHDVVTFLESKFVKKIEIQLAEVEKQILDKARILTDLQFANSQCLAIYQTVIADQVWFSKIH